MPNITNLHKVKHRFIKNTKINSLTSSIFISALFWVSEHKINEMRLEIKFKKKYYINFWLEGKTIQIHFVFCRNFDLILSFLNEDSMYTCIHCLLPFQGLYEFNFRIFSVLLELEVHYQIETFSFLLYVQKI